MRFDTLLIANRGEIACRVIRGARALGMKTVAVYSEADADARHVALADCAVALGAAPAAQSYLNQAAVIAAAHASGAGAIHPGYGFLSENAEFAAAVAAAGLVFVGPSAAAIRALGNKSAAKQLARRHQVPCLPGTEQAGRSLEAFAADAQAIGFPLMVKAAAGGGGRGMRRVDSADTLLGAFEAAAAEAQAAFGSSELLVERLVSDARHIEVQVFGDQHGNYVHLGERDCSTQRRNQKIIEEAPAPGVGAALRERLGAAAIALARAAGYTNAGTVEFLLEPNGRFHLLEMNTRLQVEHPVTELITGLDLVQWQLRVALGEPLPLTQSQISWRGHAIELRLCAEDAYANFVPQTGTVLHFKPPAHARTDHGLGEQTEVTPFYDSMLAKLIVHADDREAARCQAVLAARQTELLGLTTNRDFLIACLQSPQFCAPALSIRWVDTWLAAQPPAAPAAPPTWCALAAAQIAARGADRHGALAYWSSSGPRPLPIEFAYARASRALTGAAGVQGTEVSAEVRFDPDAGCQVRIGEHSYSIRIDARRAVAQIDTLTLPIALRDDGELLHLQLDGFSAAAIDLSTRAKRRAGSPADAGELIAAMHARVARLLKQVGDPVTAGEPVLALEAMKMEHLINAGCAGTLVELPVKVGQQVTPGKLLGRITVDAPPTGATASAQPSG